MTTNIHPNKQTTVEPQRRNNYNEPLCDDCGMVVVDRENDKFGDSCLCQGCQNAYKHELEQEFGN